jgi:hypothetical protein
MATRFRDAVKESFAHRSRSELAILACRAPPWSHRRRGFELALQNKAFLHLLARDRVVDPITGKLVIQLSAAPSSATLRNRFPRRIRCAARQSR